MDVAIPSFTILRVKRKLNPDESSSNANPDDRFQSFKRLRHIGSFSSATRPDEDTLVKNNLLKQLVGLDTANTTNSVTGSGSKKRVKISDLNSEQFQAVVERLEEEKKNPNKKKKSSKEEEEEEDSNNADPDNNNGIFNIKLTEDDLTVEDKENRNHRKETESITCNGHLLEVVDNVPKEDEYVFDYYVYTEDLLLDDGFDVPPEGTQDAVDEDSNDENYRYNDYPDEDDFTDKEDDDSNSERSDTYGDGDDDEGVNVYGFRQFDYDEEREYYDADDDEDEDICAQFDRKMQLEKILKKNGVDNNNSDDDELDDDDVDDGLMV